MSRSALETPMMKQFLELKAQYPDSVIFYRMGDFYEMFLEDAELVAPLLDIALTSRDKGKADAVPMCGVPVHAAEGHIKRLASLGHRIAICEQIEDPKEIGGKRLLRRAVVEVVTPGLIGDPTGLEAHAVVAVAAIYRDSETKGIGLAVLDATTADFRGTLVVSEAGNAPTAPADSLPDLLVQELARIGPKELLVPIELTAPAHRLLDDIIENLAIREVSERFFREKPTAKDWSGDFLNADDAASCAAICLANYLIENQPFALERPPQLRRYEIADSVILDASTRRHLELHENSEDRGRDGTLIAELDLTSSPLGSRRLSRWLSYPLVSTRDINHRQNAVARLVAEDRTRTRLRDAIRPVRDLDRLLSKATRPGAVPRDLGSLRSSLAAIPQVISALLVEESGDSKSAPLWTGADSTEAPVAGTSLDSPADLPDLTKLLEVGLVDDPPIIARGSRGANVTGYIRKGYCAELDELRESATKGREWIAGLEALERERSGINTLKIRFHPVHGYSLEVGKAHLSRVPLDFERKQTLANVERFTTEALREVESKVMGASERAAKLEREIFEKLRTAVCLESEAIREIASRVATLDALASLAEVARRNRWIRPEVDQTEGLEIRGGRHPVVESLLGRQGMDGFVPNDTDLDPAGRQILLLTGPNMSGKSTYLRQVALIVLMAQMGSYVPAESARIGVVDRVFTRVGASDRLSRGESTFMVEMRETAEILRQSSRRSLVILDEIGRGTSTFDGLSIAWAVAEYLHDTKGAEARTLFATHYHELVALSDSKARIHNAHFEVREWNDEVIFLRRLVDGGASRSYGIQVARLAGLPGSVIARARSILVDLEAGELPGGQVLNPNPSKAGQLALALQPLRSQKGEAEAEFLRAFRALEPDAMTPIDALTWLVRSAGTLRTATAEGQTVGDEIRRRSRMEPDEGST